MSLYLLPFPAFDPVLISFGPVAIRFDVASVRLRQNGSAIVDVFEDAF